MMPAANSVKIKSLGSACNRRAPTAAYSDSCAFRGAGPGFFVVPRAEGLVSPLYLSLRASYAHSRWSKSHSAPGMTAVTLRSAQPRSTDCRNAAGSVPRRLARVSTNTAQRAFQSTFGSNTEGGQATYQQAWQGREGEWGYA